MPINSSAQIVCYSNIKFRPVFIGHYINITYFSHIFNMLYLGLDAK